MFNVPLKSKQEVIELIRNYFDPIIKIKANKNLTYHSTGCLYGAEIIAHNYLEYSPEGSVIGILHECCHLLFCRSYWDSARHSNDLYQWAVEDLPNNGHPYVQMDEMCVCRLGQNIIVKLDIVLETIAYDATSDERSPQLLEFKHPEGAGRDANQTGTDEIPDEPLQYKLSLLPVKNLLIDPTLDCVALKCDIDFHPFYPFQRWHNRQYDDNYIKEPISLEEFKKICLAHPMIYRYGQKFPELCGILDANGKLIGRCDPHEVIKNRDELLELFYIPKTSAGAFNPSEEFINFLTTGMFDANGKVIEL